MKRGLTRAVIKTPEDFKQVMTMIAQATQEDFEVILKKLALDAFRSVIRESQVKTGYLRHNWDIAVDSKPVEEPKADAGGKRYAKPKPLDVDSYAIKFNSIVIIYNNTEYAIYLENGTPKMRAYPMIRPTEQMLMRTAEKLVKALSKQGYNI